MKTDVVLETVPPTCLVEDVCRLLKISRTQFFARQSQLRRLGILVEQVPKLDRKLRFQGAPIAEWLSEDGQAAHTRRVLRAVSGGRR